VLALEIAVAHFASGGLLPHLLLTASGKPASVYLFERENMPWVVDQTRDFEKKNKKNSFPL
jgi:hypothetical protein